MNPDLVRIGVSTPVDGIIKRFPFGSIHSHVATGKTITVLSLILQTSGLSVKHVDDLDSDAENKSIFDCYWRKHMTADYRRKDLFALHNTIIRNAPRGILIPTDFKKQLVNDFYGADFDAFERDME